MMLCIFLTFNYLSIFQIVFPLYRSIEILFDYKSVYSGTYIEIIYGIN